MLNKREGLFADASCGSLDSAELVVAAAHVLLLFFASDSLEEIPGAFQYSEGAYHLLYSADASRKCEVVPCVDDVLENSLNAKGILAGQMSEVLQRCGDRVSTRKTKQFICVQLSDI